jgi:hypothetical protein
VSARYRHGLPDFTSYAGALGQSQEGSARANEQRSLPTRFNRTPYSTRETVLKMCKENSGAITRHFVKLPWESMGIHYAAILSPLFASKIEGFMPDDQRGCA